MTLAGTDVEGCGVKDPLKLLVLAMPNHGDFGAWIIEQRAVLLPALELCLK